MFSVKCRLKQLKPDFILDQVLTAEECRWAKVHFGGQDDQDTASPSAGSSVHQAPLVISDVQEPGVVLLKHGTSVGNVHNFFSQLEFRKCCLHLAGRQSTSQSIRVVHQCGMDDGSSKKERSPYVLVSHLEDKELRAFKHAYLCAAYPVLAAPDPPSPLSSPPLLKTSHSLSPRSPCTDVSSSIRSFIGKASPASLADSGLEETEELVFVPAESICNHLQRAFHLSDEKFRDYRYLINKAYVRKAQSAQKLLAEQLSGQLAVLENDSHPFYKPEEFLAPHGYETWRKTEYDLITELLGKFWPYSLPLPRDSLEVMADLNSVHEDYCILLKKLVMFEREWKDQTEELAQKSPLSSASVRLLKEFGLRYGVGELYRRVQYLDQVSAEFSPVCWHLKHVLSILSGIAELLPKDRKAWSIVSQEFEMLQTCLLRLSTQSAKALEQMKSLFPNNKPVGGVDLLIKVIQRVQEMQQYLQPSLKNSMPTLQTFLRNTVQGMFFQTYEKYKTVVRVELKQSRDIHICPRMLSALIMEIRNEVCDYRNNFDAVFAPYFDICVLAAKSFYAFLMMDVEVLCQQEILRNTAINLRMLALAYRLNQLDSDWSIYIKLQNQTWRLSFQTHIAHWVAAVGQHTQDMVLQAVAGDAFTSGQLEMDTGRRSTFSSTSSLHSAQLPTFTHSPNSAFSSITSGSIPDTSQLQDSLHTSAHISPVLHPPDKTPTLQQDSSGSSQSPKDFLSFANLRRSCSSMPVFAERPAIVRNMSEYRMAEKVPPSCILHASAVEDLTTDYGEFAFVPAPSSGLKVVSEDADLDGRKDVLEPSVGLSAGLGKIKMVVGFDKDLEVDLSDEELEASQYPPLQDVTDHNMTMSPGAGCSKQGAEKGRAVTDGQGQEARKIVDKITAKPALRPEPLRSISQEREQERLRKLGSVGRGGRLSCPHPHPQARERHAQGFQPFPAGQQDSFVRRIGSPFLGVDNDHRFLQSLQSTISFPTPTPSHEAIVPVSSSSIDLIVLLRRTRGFALSLHKTIFLSACWDEGQDDRGQPGVTHSGDNSNMCSVLASFLSSTNASLVEVICQVIRVYADNMLCLDLCAVPRDMAKRIVGATLVDSMIEQRKKERIWGCRHQLEGFSSCFAFHNSKAKMLADRYEPVTQKMCIRINNLVACQHFLKWCQEKMFSADLYTSATPGVSSRSGLDSHHQPYDGGDSQSCRQTSYNGGKLPCVEKTATHLMSVWSALCRLLAFRINLFLRDGLIVLLSLKPPHVSIATCLEPLTVFLSNHLSALSSWLYHNSFKRVIENLWVFIVQDIEIEAGRLRSDKKGLKVIPPHLLLQALTHLMKFMNNCEKGITREMLLSQADAVVTKLQLFTMSTLQVIALYQRLLEMQSRDEVTDEDSQDSVPVLALHQLRHDLLMKQKCFSGYQLVDWIMHNADLFFSLDELSLCQGQCVMGTGKAVATAQRLLDLGYIMDVDEADILSESFSSSSTTGEPAQYPDVSVHEQLVSSGGDVTPTPSPADTPTPVSAVNISSQQWKHLPSGDRQLYNSSESCTSTKIAPNLEPFSDQVGLAREKTGMDDRNGKNLAAASFMSATETVRCDQEAATVCDQTDESSRMQDSTTTEVRTDENSDDSECTQRKMFGNPEQGVQIHSIGAVVTSSTYFTMAKENEKAEFEDSGVAVGHHESCSDVGGSSSEVTTTLDPLTKPAHSSTLSQARLSSHRDVLQTCVMKEETHTHSLTQMAYEGSLLSATVLPALSLGSKTYNSSNSLLVQKQQQVSADIRDDLSTTPTPCQEPANDLDLTSSRDTLLSFAENLPDVFSCSSDRFYFMPPSAASLRHNSRYNSHHHDHGLSKVLLSPIECLLQHLKHSEETMSLAEKCFFLKITPSSLLSVLYSRRRTDDLARRVVDQLSPHLWQQVLSGAELQDAAECSLL